MSFFSQLKDEVNDKNIDKAKLKELTKTIREDPAEKPEAPQKKKTVQEDPEYPDHPDYIALKPRMTEVKLWNMPAIRFYLTLIFFCAGMILYGIINQVFALGMTKGAVGWWQLIGGAAGFLLSREYVEPHLRIPFSKGTPEQKKRLSNSTLLRSKHWMTTLKSCAICRVWNSPRRNRNLSSR